MRTMSAPTMAEYYSQAWRITAGNKVLFVKAFKKCGSRLNLILKLQKAPFCRCFEFVKHVSCHIWGARPMFGILDAIFTRQDNSFICVKYRTKLLTANVGLFISIITVHIDVKNINLQIKKHKKTCFLHFYKNIF